MSELPYIAISGSHSVGKSTLVKALVPVLESLYHKPIYYISEVTRRLKETRKLSINKEGTPETQRLIESAYAQEEESHADSIRIADRSVLDRFAYTILSSAREDSDLLAWYSNNINRICNKYTHLFYVPITPNLKLELDGVRSPDETFRIQVDRLINSAIQTYRVNTHVLVGSTEERINQVKKVLGV